MATAAVARPANVLRQRRTDAPRLTLGKRVNPSSMDGNETAQLAKRRKLAEPYVRNNDYILKKHKGKQASIVVHLHNNYWKFGGQDSSFGYDSQMAVVLKHLRRGTVPHEMMAELLGEQVLWYDGCLIVEVHNHRTAEGKEKGKARDDAMKFSMHAYNEHITPSAMAPYPKKARTDEDGAKVNGTSGSEEAQPDKQKDKAKDRPIVFTTVLHPTELSRHHELLIFAKTPASDMRSKKKGSTDTPMSAQPPTPSLSVPPTPLMTTRGPLTKDQKMCLEGGELNSVLADILVATEPPLYLEPVDNPHDAQRILDMLSHPLHKSKPPSPKARKKTTAQVAADDAQAAEAERRMLIMDERIKPSARTGAGVVAESNQATAASLGFSRFKTIEMVRQKHEENQIIKKEEADRAAVEKKLHDEQNTIRQQQILHQQKQREMAVQLQQQGNNHTMAQKQALLHAQRHQQGLQQRDAQMAAGREHHGHPNAAANAMMQAQQQHLANSQQQAQNMAMQGSPVMQHNTPSGMMNSSPMMQNGGFAMVPTSSQGAGSPARPPSAIMQNRNVQMARQASQQHHGSQNNTPQLPQGTPSMPQVMPNRQMTQTPRLPPGSPASAMHGTPTSVNGLPMTMPTPHMMQGNVGANLTQEQIMMLQAQQRNLQLAGSHAGSPPTGAQGGGGHNMQNLTPEQVQQINRQQMRQQALMHVQQQQAQANGQSVQMTPQQQQNYLKMQMVRRAQMAQLQAQQQAQQMQQMGIVNGAAGSPAPPQPGMQQPTPTPQMAHAHPQTPQQQAQMQQQQQQANGPGQPADFQRQQHQQMAIAHHRAQAIAAQREAHTQLLRVSQQFGGNLAQIPANVVATLPVPVRQMLQQQLGKQAGIRQAHMQQMRAQQQLQQQQQQQQQQNGQQGGGGPVGGGGGQGGGGDGVVPAGQPNPVYMQQLRHNQALLSNHMAQQQALQQQQQNGGGMGMAGMGMNGMSGMNMGGQNFGVNGNGGGQLQQQQQPQQQGGGGGGNDLNQYFLNMQNALERQNSGQGNGMQ
ncbi:Transcription factor spt20 [Friedmanniomyces endolithicus]|nr:Transcription factor spt20 [Friedmanniomyces endolithicus]